MTLSPYQVSTKIKPEQDMVQLQYSLDTASVTYDAQKGYVPLVTVPLVTVHRERYVPRPERVRALPWLKVRKGLAQGRHTIKMRSAQGPHRVRTGSA